MKEMTPEELAEFEYYLNPWPEPEPIEDDIPRVQPFDLRYLPPSFRDWVADIAERMQVPPDFPATVTVLSLAGVVNRRALMQPKSADTSWVVVPNLYGGIIAAPRLLKSPVIQAITRPLQQIEESWCREQLEAEADYSRLKEEYDLRRSAWREQYKINVKSGKTVERWCENEPTAPRQKRLIINDATFEALHEILSANPAGVLVIRDELTGWWSQLDRHGREGERAFYLEAWNGDIAHTVDRIERGSVHASACSLSMLGGIQPARLRSYLVPAVTDGPSNDGLIQRFQ